MRLIDGSELYNIEKLLDTDIISNSKEASFLMSQVLYDIQAQPTIDPETLPIVQELRANIAIQEKIIENHHNPFDTDKIVKLTLENANLKQQLSKVTEERDKALEDLKLATFYGMCEVCKYYNQSTSDCSCSRECFDSAEWEYRGLQEE